MKAKESGEKKRRRKKKVLLSRLHKPEAMTTEAWQVGLRRQFGRQQAFRLENLGDEPVFSDFQVTNPETNGSYRVAIRGARLGENYCSCPDFATNTLGTCKHIEFALAKVSRRPGAKTILKAGFQPERSEIYLLYGAQREIRLRRGSDMPESLARLSEDVFDPTGVLRPGAFDRLDAFIAAAEQSGHESKCFDDVLGFVAEVRDQVRRREVLQTAFPDGIRSNAFEKLVKVSLYDYQREGALFAARAGRSLIGDEMGLGKTIQAIAAVEIMARHFGVERVLIICPTSLKHQWEREIARFVERSAQVIGGMTTRRREGYASETFYKIANYDTIHRDLDLIGAWSPDVVILDEAQRIKNWSTRVARSVKRINSPYAIVLTGTPLENRLEELVSIVQFVDRHRLGPTFRFLADHQVQEPETGRVIGYKDLDGIGKSLEPVLIRRRKSQVLTQLPGRLDKHLFVAMTPEQMVHHDDNKLVVHQVVAKWRRFHFLSEADKLKLMIALQNMRMSCDSTYLLDQETDFGRKADELMTLLEEAYEQQDTKVVIFSQWVRMNELVVRRFGKRRWGHVMFNGSIPGTKRKALIDRFRDDAKCRAFLSTDAGGVGLNLQHASVVVNLDLPWNPAVLEQRIGRVHRLGQTQPVRVLNFVSQGTIEEGMLSLLKFKTSLFAGALDGGDKDVSMGGSRLTKFMESVQTATESIPHPAAQDPPPEPEPATNGSAAKAPGGEPAAADLVSAPQPTAGNPWAGLLQTGLAVLQQLAAAAPAGNGGSAPKRDAGNAFVHRDPATGENYLKLPMPTPEVLDQILGAVGTLLERFRK